MKKTIVFATLLTLSQAGLGATCPKPNEYAASAFKLIETSSAAQLETYLKKYTVSRTAVNEKCEDMYALALREKNEGVRLLLERIGYGPRNAKELNETKKFEKSYFDYALSYSPLNVIKEFVKKGGERYYDLTYAAAENTIDVIDYFLEKNNAHPDSVIEYAVGSNTISVIDELIRRGANTSKEVVLSAAIYRKDLEVIELVVRSGAPVLKEHLRLSAQLNSIEIFEFLRASSAENLDPSFLEPVVQRGNIEMLKHLLSLGLPITHRTKESRASLILLAISGSQISMVEFLQTQGLSLKDVNGNGLGAIYYAETVSMLKYLRSKGFEISNGELEVPARFDRTSRVEALLKAGANPNGTTSSGEGIFVSLFKGNSLPSLEMVELFLSAGANVNQKNSEGYTALMLAARKNYWDTSAPAMIRFLMSRGADKTIFVRVDYEKLTAADLYKKNSNRDPSIYELLRTR